MPAKSGDKKKPLYGEPAKQDPLYGEGGDSTDDVPDPEAAEREGKKHAKKSAKKAQRSSGGGGQEGI
jgi:hypothetical protein